MAAVGAASAYRSILVQGFDFRGRRIPLIGPQGIFKPAALDLPLSITTAPLVLGSPRPYNDHIGYDGLLKYRYRGGGTPKDWLRLLRRPTQGPIV